MSLQELFNDKKEKGCVCLCGLKFKQQKAEVFPNHLNNWELWMRRRKKTHKILSRKLKCASGDLLMNYGDILYRNTKEEKLALEYTKIETHFDKYRGNPDFWKLPCCLKNKLPPYGGTEYFCVKSKIEKNEIPPIEYVQVPDVILEEKDIMPRTRHLKNLWRQSSYRKEVVERISDKLSEIEPHKPDLTDLLILGSNILTLPTEQLLPNDLTIKENRSTKVITKESNDLESINEIESEISLLECFNRVSIKINRMEFNQYCDKSYKENKLTVMFEYFIGSAVPCRQYILFENTGKVVLRISWKQYIKQKLFRDYTQRSNIYHPFKFDKNELILLPGAQKKLPIWFQVEKPGNFFEYWEITSLPKVWKSDCRLIILLKGFAFIKNYKQGMQKITDKLNQMVRITTVKDLLNDIIKKGNYCVPHQTHSFHFSEEEIFESINVVNNIKTQTSKYNYNPEIINELKAFYKETMFPNDPEQWNLSINKLIENSRKKDLFVYCESKLNLYDAVKLNRKYLQDNIPEGQNKTGVKQENVSKKQISPPDKEPLQESGDNIPNTTFYSKLNKILKTLEKPSIYKNKERKKHLFCFLTVKTLFWQMLDQLHKLDNNGAVPNESWPQCEMKIKEYHQVPDRLLYEIFDECYILRTKRISHISGTPNAKHKSLLLKNISISDIKKVHKSYFNKEDVNQKAPKAKTDANEKLQRGQKTKDSVIQEQDQYQDINDNYDPFSETFSCIYQKPSTISHTDKSVSLNKKTDEHKYLIVYTALCQTVNSIVDIIEAINESNIASDTLYELQKCDESYNKKQVEKTSKEIFDVNFKTEDSQSDYFEYLQKLHWHSNVSTKKYFIKEEKLARNSEMCSKSKQILNEKDELKTSPENMFCLEDFRRKSEEYCLKNMATQTIDLKETDSKNIFYFYKDRAEN